MVQNKGLIFKNPPSGWPIQGHDIAVESREFDLNQEPPQNGVTTKNFYASFDPYQRNKMRGPENKSYSASYKIGEPITNSIVASVLKSNNEKLAPGDVITGLLPIEEYSSVEGALAQTVLKRLDNPLMLDPKLFIGALGMTGLTAYSSFFAIGEPKAGETIFISAASGAVGQIVGQLAKHERLTVIGSVGSDEKLEFIKNDLGFDDGFNYKKEKAADALKRLAPKGVDIYYENVGGEQLDAALGAMNAFGRISQYQFPHIVVPSGTDKISTVCCGMISQYNAKDDSEKYGVKQLTNVVGKRLKMQGFIVSDPDMGPKHTAEHQKNLQKWLHEGSFKVQQSVTMGIDNAVEGFLGMLKGENFGKAVLQIDELKQ